MIPNRYTLQFPTGHVQYLLESDMSLLPTLAGTDIIIITDTNVAALYPALELQYRTIAIPAGEAHKDQHTVDNIIESLLEMKAHRKTFLIGVGGGMVTDIAGYVASIYMRGIPFGFVPTSLLSMVDAAIGGKNGINHRLQKNLIGTINQPGFILFDTTFLQTLPVVEWSNGFAEIIKYACLFDKALFEELERYDLAYYREQPAALKQLIIKCTGWKNQTVLADEKESGKRKLLNFGHTAGHAMETLYNLPHGAAVALGMLVACMVSQSINKLDTHIYTRLVSILKKYGLPYKYDLEIMQVMEILRMDKKRNDTDIDFITLHTIGNGVVSTIPFQVIEDALISFAHAGDN